MNIVVGVGVGVVIGVGVVVGVKCCLGSVFGLCDWICVLKL